MMSVMGVGSRITTPNCFSKRHSTFSKKYGMRIKNCYPLRKLLAELKLKIIKLLTELKLNVDPDVSEWVRNLLCSLFFLSKSMAKHLQTGD